MLPILYLNSNFFILSATLKRNGTAILIQKIALEYEFLARKINQFPYFFSIYAYIDKQSCEVIKIHVSLNNQAQSFSNL